MPAERPAFGPTFLEGIERFNEGRYWDAHESWERLWLCASSPFKQFIQGLIQLAAGYHHLQCGGGFQSAAPSAANERHHTGAIKLLDSALAKLTPFPENYCGIDRKALVSDARADREKAATGEGTIRFPRIPIPQESGFPGESEW